MKYNKNESAMPTSELSLFLLNKRYSAVVLDVKGSFEAVVEAQWSHI